MMLERLQKIIAERGIASRRAAETMILAGRVSVNGQVVQVLGVKADPEQDDIRVDGEILPKQSATPVYVLLYKPAGYITSVSDPQKRRTVMDLLPQKTRIYPVGRLDYATSGLLTLTNDGALTNGLLHPKREVLKTYECAVRGKVSQGQLRQLRNGIHLTDGLTAPAQAKIKKEGAAQTVVSLTIHEGRNRQVRRMMAALHLDVVWLCRKQFAGLTLTGLKPGQWRYLTKTEVESLKKQAGISE